MINWGNVLIWALIVVAVLIFMWAQGKIHNILLLLVDMSNNNKLQEFIENEHEIEAPVRQVALTVQLVLTLAMVAPVLYIFWLIIK